jgi:hypothetical protein
MSMKMPFADFPLQSATRIPKKSKHRSWPKREAGSGPKEASAVRRTPGDTRILIFSRFYLGQQGAVGDDGFYRFHPSENLWEFAKLMFSV